MTHLDVLKSQLLIVDDHPLFREGFVATIQREPDLEVVAEAGTAADAMEAARTVAFDVAVVDVLLPTTSGVTLVGTLLDLVPRCKILALSVLQEPTVIATMLKAGAHGYALKTQHPAQITDAIRAILIGQRYLPPLVALSSVMELARGSRGRPLERLTRREREVFDLLLVGHTNEQIASKLFISKRTVETHRQRIMKKLDAHSLLDMIRVAAKQGAFAH